jgi:hypothetical protein
MYSVADKPARGIVFSLGTMAVLPRGTFAFFNIAESLRSM